jgi:phosphohistidine phosphatase
MKTLMLLRHAKSSWDDTRLRDFDRPLAERGKRDAPRMGKALRERGPAPDLIVSSTAARAQATVEAFVKAAGLEIEPRFDGSIYDATTADLMKLAGKLPDDRSTVLLVGHNPGFEDMVARLTGACERMPTAALACIELDIDRWEEVEEGKGRLLWRLTPKQLDDDKE